MALEDEEDGDEEEGGSGEESGSEEEMEDVEFGGSSGELSPPKKHALNPNRDL